MDTMQTWVNGGEVILKKVARGYSLRLANKIGDWIQGLPDGIAWADTQAKTQWLYTVPRLWVN
jgi:hypothetical protein